MNKKIIIKFIKKTVLTALFAFLFLIFSLIIILLILKFKEKNISIKEIFFSFIILLRIIYTGLYYYFVLPLVIFFGGLLSYKIDKLCKKHSFSLELKNKSKRFNSFFTYFIKGFFGFSIVVMVIYSDKKEIYNFLEKKNIHIPNLIISERATVSYLIWIFFSLFYIFLFHFIADKFIGFYKKRKDLKIK